MNNFRLTFGVRKTLAKLRKRQNNVNSMSLDIAVIISRVKAEINELQEENLAPGAYANLTSSLFQLDLGLEFVEKAAHGLLAETRDIVKVMTPNELQRFFGTKENKIEGI